MQKKRRSHSFSLLCHLPSCLRDSGRRLLPHVRNELERIRISCRALRAEPPAILPHRLEGAYLLSANTGVFLLRENRLQRILPFRAYGIARDGKALFLAVHSPENSLILRYDCDGVTESGFSEVRPRLLGCWSASATHDRIHAICTGPGNSLLIANTGRNTITRIDRDSGAVLGETPVLRDAFDMPVYYNLHHVNSVTAIGDTVLFVASQVGRHSMIGVLNRDCIRLYPAGLNGVHDVFFSGRNFYYCSSFGDPEAGVFSSGTLCRNGRPLDADYFREHPCTVRGLAGNPEGEMLLGDSVRGDRQHREHGTAALLVLQASRVRHRIALPGLAQVHQILQMDGTRLDGAPEALSEGDIHCILQDALGAPALEQRLLPPSHLSRMKWGVTEGRPHL